MLILEVYAIKKMSRLQSLRVSNSCWLLVCGHGHAWRSEDSPAVSSLLPTLHGSQGSNLYHQTYVRSALPAQLSHQPKRLFFLSYRLNLLSFRDNLLTLNSWHFSVSVSLYVSVGQKTSQNALPQVLSFSIFKKILVLLFETGLLAVVLHFAVRPR